MAALIRLALPGDGPALAEIYRPAVADNATSFELEPPDGAEMARRAAKCMERTPWLVYERDDRVLGYAYAGTHRERAAYQWSVEVSAYVHHDFQKQGIARALYASLFAALAVQGFRNAYAGVTLPNDASVKLHAAVGFTPVGVYRGIGYKFGAWHDVAWFERALAPRVGDPPLPLPLAECRGDPAFAAAIAGGVIEWVFFDRSPRGGFGAALVLAGLIKIVAHVKGIPAWPRRQRGDQADAFDPSRG